MSEDQSRPVDGLAEQLDRIEANASAAYDEARKAREESEKTNGRLREVERDLYGPSERRKRENQPGLVGEFRKVKQLVYDVVSSRDESQAVKGAMRWIVGLGVSVVVMMLAALTLLLQLTGNI